MADQIKEIATATITPEDLTGNQFSGTLFSTDANTQYHATEITLGGTFPIAADIEVNNYKATQITQEQRGSAIVDVNSSVRLAFQTPIDFSQEHFNFAITSGTAIIENRFNVNDSEVKSENNVIGNDNVINWAQGGLLSRSSSGAIFYHNTNLSNSTTLVRFLNGTQTNIDTLTMRPKAYDGDRYYYWINSANNAIIRYDIETETSTSTSLQSSINSAVDNPRLVYSNGVLLYIPQVYATQHFIIDPSTGRVSYISISSDFFIQGQSGVGFYFDPDTRECSAFAWSSASTLAKAVYVCPPFTVPATSGNGLVLTNKTASFFAPDLDTQCIASICATGLNTFIHLTVDVAFQEYDYDIPASLRIISLAKNTTNRTSFYARNSVLSPSNTDFPVTAKVRFAGVETTI